MSFHPTTIEIRRMTAADLDRVLEIAASHAAAPHWSRQSYVELFSANPSRPRIPLVAYRPGTGDVLAFAIVSLISPEADLETISVKTDAQRQGVGRQLLVAMIAELRQAEISELLLEVRASNCKAIQFYQSMNFKQTGTRLRYYTDPIEDAVLMALQIA